ncbi:MAG TPA: NAD(P)/FAD-dependent oxidoreductase [Polyangiaceae bacterium]|jgi:phytoene dehydrogenase-like protein
MSSWDTVVIGSGPGGLTAAVALARAGQRVLVLEQHYLPGGWTHSFALDGHRFSPGVHYIGDLHPGGGVRNVYEGLGLTGDLEFCEMNPDGFDHFIVGGERIDQPKGQRAWRDRLIARFPREQRGIEAYFDLLERIVRDVQRCDELLEFPTALTLPFRAPTLFRHGFGTLAPAIDRFIADPMLKAFLVAQCGNHGLAPSRASLPAHAIMAAHYYEGAYYPRGGARRIPQAYIKELRRRGGSIRTRTRVERILVEGGRAVGVAIAGGEVIRANDVVCNADPGAVFGKLLAKEHCQGEIRKVQKMEWSTSFLSCFCVVDMPLRAMGYDSGNYWWYRTADLDGIYRRMEVDLPGAEVDALFVAISSLKDPTEGRDGPHTIEMFTFVPYGPFAKWGGSAQGQRAPEYVELKRWLGTQMVAAAENVIPGFSRHLRFCEVGTPLTNDFYCETVRGAAYGTAKTPWQLGPFSFSQRSSVEHLHFCGASTMSHGVGGASLTGLVSAQHVLGLARRDDCLSKPDGSLRIYPAEHPEIWVKRAA